MILTDSKKSQAKTVIGLESVARVSVTSFKDGLFCLHQSEVSELVGGRVPPWRRQWTSQGWGGLEVMGTRPLALAFDISQAAPEEKKLTPFLLFFSLLKISSVGSKGDFLLVSEHVVELLTKMYRAVLETTQRRLPVTVTEQ